MDLRRACRNALLATALLASGAVRASCGGTTVTARDLFAPARQAFRLATELIRLDAPAAPAGTSITTGVRG